MSSVSQLGKFEITGQLGQGSFGVVYRGRDPHLNRDVAIKVCTLDDDELRQRFLREAAISGRLDHRNIVTVHEYSSEGASPYLVQEFLSGEDLRQVIKDRRPWSVERRLDALAQIAEGLAYAHQEGVIHRDIKPANVRVLDDGRLKILDFGIAKLANDESRLTQKGVTMGTASYLPPEQVRGGEVDTRSDLFSFGVLAYELLSFERPFRGKTISALVYQILYKVPAPLTAVWPDCPRELSDLVARCLEKEPEKRFAEAKDLAAELVALRQDVAGGRWPALLSGSGAQPRVMEEEASASTSDLLSRSMISRAADEASERAADHTATASSGLPIRRDSEATQPVPIIPPPKAPPSARTPPTPAPRTPARKPAHEDAATVAMSLSDLPPVSQPQGGEGEPDELATSGIEIGKLVAQGDLDAALEQLEETIHRRRREGDEETESAELPPPLPNTPPAAAKVEDRAQGAGTSATATAGRAPAVPGDQDLRPAAPPPPPRKKSLPVPWVVGIGAAVMILAALAAIFLGRDQKPERQVTPAAIPTPPPPVEVTEELGSLLVQTTPWAEITEITDESGYVHDLPADATTPLHLRLPEGLYRLTLLVPSLVGGEGKEGEASEIICEVRVSLGEVATCMEVIGEPTAVELFKDAGWWP